MPARQRKSVASALLLSSLLVQPVGASAATLDDAVEPAVSEISPTADSADTVAGEAAASDDTPNWAESTLTGDWGGKRKRLHAAGVQADLLYTADFLHNSSGGLKSGGTYVGHVDLILQLDGEKLIGWQGGSAYLQLISNGGGRFNLNYLGSLMGADNLEAPVNRTGLFKAWLQQSASHLSRDNL
ncbi:hypothetical protein [Candidatus Accumulibacter contiguus]|uniref:hypothetical protein n=1 Tax=Candidatus Accumulibacter contiguus TaxID=2954381 RepID=UPI002FC345D6